MYIGRDWPIVHDQRVKVNNAELLYTLVGEGEPVLCIHGVNIADAITAPFQFYPELFEKYQFISYYRAGYNGSTMEKDSVSIEEGAEHAKQLLEHLGIEKTHLVAFSFGGVIAFQFLLSYPELVQSAVLLEAYLPRESQEAIDANTQAYMQAIELFQAGDKLGASQRYQTAICGPSFLSSVDLTCPLDVWDKVEAAAETVFTVDMPAYMNWSFRPSQADKFAAQKPNMPILAVMGVESENACPGFRETQHFLMNWLPQAERCGIMSATHGLQIMNPIAVAEATMRFLQKHPLS